jgi:hypothetical protein
MAFHAKTDYCGLSALTALAGKIVVKDATDNDSVEKYQPQGADGSFVLTHVYGKDSAPANTYGVKANIGTEDGDVKLNALVTVGEKKYALESFEIGTSAGSAPTLSATCQLVEDTATDAAQCHYPVPAFALTTKQHAQDIFSAFEIAGEGCVLTECSASVGGSITKDKNAGEIIASDISQGVITVTGTILQTGDVAPTLTAKGDFVVTAPPSCTNAETAYKTYSFELQRILAKV